MATYTIKVPAEIKLDVQYLLILNIEFITAISKATKFDSILFDFSRTNWIDAEMTVLLSMMFELALQTTKSVSVDIETMPEKVKTILQKNNFFPYYGLGEKLLDTYNTTITFFADNTSKDAYIYEYIKEEVFSAIGTKISDDFLKEISYCIFEIIHNVRDHSGADRFYICGQHYPKTGILRLAISDLGVGVPAKVKERQPHLKTDVEAVEWAFIDGNTTKRRKEGGVGLYSIKELLHNRGQLKLVSNQAYYSVSSSGIIETVTMPQRFRGTLL
ncbi:MULTISPECIES: ATP-binding protein [unclassified Streptococcus]|uniref:ATP-binding protein n=1 Tax=unclassified Streptococcus TaxID=2608887 RepID=UPI001D16C324|nr:MULTISPECIES: ATP-binding protein [unclassified Streptococcus]